MLSYPIATYRVQLNKEFPLDQARALLPFLRKMGISHLYASPVFAARRGSMQGSRFRHTAQFRRWRPDKKPPDCTYAQLEVVPPQELAAIFGKG